MSVPFQYTSRHESLGGSLGPAIMFTLVFGLTGVYVNLPPLGPPGSTLRARINGSVALTAEARSGQGRMGIASASIVARSSRLRTQRIIRAVRWPM